MLLHRLRPQLRYHQLNTISIILVLAAVSTLFAGCFGGGLDEESPPRVTALCRTYRWRCRQGAAHFRYDGDGGPAQSKLFSLGAGIPLEQELTVNTSNMTAAERVYPRYLIGTWELQVWYTAGRETWPIWEMPASVVQEGKTAGIELPLRAAPGVLIMHLDISDFDDCDQPVKGRIIIGTGVEPEMVKEFTTGSSCRYSRTQRAHPQKTHDLRVELYEKTFHSYNLGSTKKPLGDCLPSGLARL